MAIKNCSEEVQWSQLFTIIYKFYNTASIKLSNNTYELGYNIFKYVSPKKKYTLK